MRGGRGAPPKLWIGSPLALGSAAGPRLARAWGFWPMARPCGGNCGRDPEPPPHRGLHVCSWHRRLALAQGQATAPFCATWRRTGWSIFAGSGERDRSRAFGCGDRQPGSRQRLCRSSPKDCAASGPGGRSLAPLAQPERGTLQPHHRILTQTTHTIRASEAPPSAVPHAEPRACHNATQLWREIRERGFHGRQSIERAWIRQRRGPRYQPEAHAITAPPLRTSPRHTAWLILTEPTAARPYLEELYRRSPEIAARASVAREFFRIVRTRDSTAWPSGFNLGDRTGQLRRPPHPRSGRDQAAVLAALQTPWSNGQVEGQVHRLKLVNRQMYGRASFDLLRLRVLNAA